MSETKMSDFLARVTKAFDRLLARQALTIESSMYDAKAFGNAAVVLAGKNFKIRVIRDRGDLFAQAVSTLHPEDWFPLQRILSAVGVSSPPPEGLLTPEQTAEIVDRYLLELENGLGQSHVEQTRKALAQIGQFAMKRLLDRAKNKQS